MRILAVAVGLALLLAGCTGSSTTTSSDGETGDGTGTNDSGSGGSTGGSTGSGTGTGSKTGTSGSNRAPAINAFTANVTTGTVPLAVRFVFNATDGDKDALTYTLAFGDATANVTGKLGALGGNLTHTYTATGNYTPRLVVSDGKISVNRTLTKIVVNVPVDVVGPPIFVLTGKTKATGNPNMCEPSPGICSPGVALGARACAGFVTGQNEVDCVFGALSADLAGHRYFVTGENQEVVDFWSSCSATTGSYVAGGRLDEPKEGVVPAGAGCAILWNYGANPTGISLTLNVY